MWKQTYPAQTQSVIDEAGNVRKRRMLVIAGTGFFTDAYALFIIGIVLTMLKSEWHPSTFTASLVISIALLASALGAITFGRLADHWGRHRIYGLEVLLLAGGALAASVSPNIWWLIGFQFVLGFGVGGDYPTSATIMSEYSANESRGRMVSMVFGMQALGLIVGPLVAVLLLASGIPHDLAWRIMLALAAVPALLVFRLRRRLSETPHFTSATAAPKNAIDQNHTSVGLAAILRDHTLKRYLLGAAGAWFLLDFAFYGNTISSSSILRLLSPQAGLTTTTLEALAIFVLAAAPGYWLAIRHIDRRGRKSIQRSGFTIMALCFLALGLYPGITTMLIPFLALYAISYFFTQYGPNITTFAYPTELFPVRSRATGHGFATAIGKLGAFVGTFLIPIMLAAWGLKGTELVVGIVCLLGLLVTEIMLPDLKTKPVEPAKAKHPIKLQPSAETVKS